MSFDSLNVTLDFTIFFIVLGILTDFIKPKSEAIKARENAVATPVSNPAIPSGLGMPVNNPVGIGGVAMPSPVGGASKLISFNM